MALIKCPECGLMVSEFAHTCPNCACPHDIIMKEHNQKYEKKVDSPRNKDGLCWFCEKERATDNYEHTFVEVQYASTTTMRKKRELSKSIVVPCCQKCKKIINAQGTYGLISGIFGTLGVLIPIDYWLYTIDPGVLIMGLVFEVAFIAKLIFSVFCCIGVFFWKKTHKSLNDTIKNCINDHPDGKNLRHYAETHPLSEPTILDYFHLK